MYHPGEKRMIKYAKTHCKILPEKIEKNINDLFKTENKEKITVLKRIITELKKILPETNA